MLMDPLERATALLRAEFLLSCESVDVSLERQGTTILLHLSFTLQSDGIARRSSHVISSTYGDARTRAAVRDPGRTLCPTKWYSVRGWPRRGR
jgi:hypothetical protein